MHSIPRVVAFISAGLAIVIGILSSSYELPASIKHYIYSGPLPSARLTEGPEQGSAAFSMANGSPKTPVYFLSHGGPNILEEPEHPAYKSLQDIGKEINTKVKPKAVVVFSAHWQGRKDRVLVNTAEITDLIYDFYGFPDWYYKVKYPHVGSRDVAQSVMSKLENAGIAYAPVDRGLDHGVWVPLLLAFNPEENPLNVPIVQVSMFKNEDPEEHYRLGKAVAALRQEGILVVGSGMAVHNLRDLWSSMDQAKPMPYVNSFEGALKEAATAKPGQRQAAMAALLKRGDARQAHPSFDHLLPVHVAAGAAEDDVGQQLFTMAEGSMSWAQYRFGDAAGNLTLPGKL